eukprot:scaffold74185_cov36-Cyclotella_meneghiniana.AAC.1
MVFHYLITYNYLLFEHLLRCNTAVRVGRVNARQFYVTQLIGWSGAAFDQVDWEARDQALKSKPDMFKTWLAKQTSTFCATGLNMVRSFDSEMSECPNCGAPDEQASHLLHCPDPGRCDHFLEGKIALDLTPTVSEDWKKAFILHLL